MKSSDVAVITLGSILACLLVVMIVSVITQTTATQCYSLTQKLFPALTAAGYQFWLDWGTLLGAQREGTMIAHDNDADIGMRESEFQRLKKDWPRHPAFKGMRLAYLRDNLYRVYQGLGWVDIFRYADDPSDVGTLTMISLDKDEHSCKCDGAGHRITKSTIFPTTTVRFGNVDAPAPKEVASYLEHLYGGDWIVPRPRKNGTTVLLNLVPLPKPYVKSNIY